MGLQFDRIAQRDQYLNVPKALVGHKEEAARRLLQGMYQRLGTWTKVAEAMGGQLSATSINNWAHGRTNIGQHHAHSILVAYRKVKHLPKLKRNQPNE